MSEGLESLSPFSAVFGEIEQELQIQFKAPRLLVSKVYEVSSAQVDAQFAALSKTVVPQNTVTVFLPFSSLGQTVADLTAKGIRVDPRAGFRFTAGSIDIDPAQDTLELIRANVLLGNPSNYQPSVAVRGHDVAFNTDPPTVDDVKEGVNSLCLGDSNEYVVFNAAQVKATHFVQLAGKNNLTQANEFDDICDLCRTQTATIYCLNCAAKLCAACDLESHAGNRILERHVRMELADARALMESCPVHPDQRVQYYDPALQVPVCLECKMTGTHSKGEAATHPLITIKQAYNEALEGAAREDPIITRRKSVIKDKILGADESLAEVIDNLATVEAELRRLFEAAVAQARELAGEKALTIRSARTELVRKQQEVELFGKLLGAHRKGSGPLAFLRACDRQAALVAGFLGTGDLPLDVRVRGDLGVFGRIDVKLSGEIPEMMDALLSRRDFGESSTVFNESPPPSPSAGGTRSSRRVKGPGDSEWTSIVAFGARREQKNRAKGVELDFLPFQGSAILTDAAKCTALYLCFPFKAQPQTHLLFSTVNNGRSIKKMHQIIDGVGITAVLVQKGTFIFGGFAAAKWRNDGQPFGEGSSSFLFSVSQDSIIPYRPKVADPAYLLATEDTLTFGKYDLVLSDNFDSCKAVIENSYGVGLEPGSTEAQTFLAGEPAFKADVVEVWGFFTIEQE